MKRFMQFTLVIFAILTFTANAQVFNGDLVFTTQAQVDFFGLTNYTSITGSLIIYYGNATGTGDIINLDSLHRLVSVGEELSIFNNANLVNINGLSNLTSIGALASVPADGSVSIVQNNSLTNIDGLSNLHYIGGTLSIYDNNILENIDGLQNLQNFDAFFQISGNPSLTNINGLTNALSPTSGGYAIGGFAIFNNDNLASISGLTNITSVYGNVDIHSNPALSNLNGLSNLQFIHGSLKISDNALITNLNELSGLELVTGTPFAGLTITDNAALTNYDGLNTLASNCGLKKPYEISGNGGDPPASLLDRFDACLANQAPVADAGEDAETIVGNVVHLDGSGSYDPDTDPLSFDWSFTNKPAGSNAELLNESDTIATFSADVPGEYTVQLIVYDGYVNSIPDLIIVTAISIPEAIQNPIDSIKALPINDGNKNALISKLQNALAKYNAGDLNAAKNILMAYINQLNQFVSDGSLTQAEAQPLIDYANTIISSINSMLSKIVESNAAELPSEYSLSQNYPNPFNPVTAIKYSIPEAGPVQLKVYDILGREAANLVDGNREAGYYEINFDGSTLASGMYLYRLTAGNFVSTKKMLMIK